MGASACWVMPTGSFNDTHATDIPRDSDIATVNNRRRREQSGCKHGCCDKKNDAAASRCKTFSSNKTLSSYPRGSLIHDCRDDMKCTSCNSGFSLMVTNHPAMAGFCTKAHAMQRVWCTGLDKNNYEDADIGGDTLCTKLTLADTKLMIRSIPRDDPRFAYFTGPDKNWFSGRRRAFTAKTFCAIWKQTICKHNVCSVKKKARLHEHLPLPHLRLLPTQVTCENVCGEAATSPDDDSCKPELCKGKYASTACRTAAKMG